MNKQGNIIFSENDLTSSDIERVNFLLLQLSSKAKAVNFEKLRRCMEKGIIFTAREEKLLIGFALLTKLEKITSFSGTVEDVIVDENYRGKKIGQHLMENLINRAQELKMEYLDLTSQDKRVAAQNLYKKIGFKKRNTNVFRKLF